MFSTKGVARMSRLSRLVLCVVAATGLSSAATIGVYSGSDAGQLWAGSGNFSSVYANATTGSLGHSVVSTNDITETNLNTYRFLVVANPTTAMNAAQVTAVTNWVKQGGILLLFADANHQSSVGIVNSILSSNGGLGAGASGAAMSVGGGTYGDGYGVVTAGSLIPNSDPAVGSMTGGLAFLYANRVNGGSMLANPNPGWYDLGNTLRVDTFQLGKVYVFGERFDSNLMAGNANNRNFFINLLSQNNQFQLPTPPPTTPTGPSFPSDPLDIHQPEPATFGIAGAALLGLLAARRRSLK